MMQSTRPVPRDGPTILSFPTPPLWACLDGRMWKWLWSWRYWYFVRIMRRVATSGSAHAFAETVQHNMRSLAQCNPRMRHLIKPLAALESVGRDARILVIGPRNEWDLMLLAREGFYNCVGVDLISYSPCVLVGDMHALAEQFPKDSFDVVLCGWTISYSAEPYLAAQQMLAVAKNGAVIGVGVEYAVDDPSLDDAWKRADGYIVQERDRLPVRINCLDDILRLFGDDVADVYWRHDAPLKRAHLPDKMVSDPSAVCAVFSVRKQQG